MMIPFVILNEQAKNEIETYPVVMIHGAGGGAWEYDFWTSTFRKGGFHTISKNLNPINGRYQDTTFQDYKNQVIEWIPNQQRPILIGASMGGILALSVSPIVNPKAIILINPVPPVGFRKPPNTSYPLLIKWENGPLKDSIDAMPDSDQETIIWAHKLWRNESGTVLNTISNPGINIQNPDCPILMVISEADTNILPETSKKLAQHLNADTLLLPKTSHVGPLLGKNAESIAKSALNWLRKNLNCQGQKARQ